MALHAYHCDHTLLQYTASLPAKWGFITADITYPATEKHIRKARKQEYHMVTAPGLSQCSKHATVKAFVLQPGPSGHAKQA